MRRLIIVSCFLIVLPFFVHATGEYEYTYHRIEAPLVSSDNLKHTTITPGLETPLDPKKNLIYAAAFQLAWNELTDRFVKERIRMQAPPPYVASLNKRLYSKGSLSPEDYVAFADYDTPANRAGLQKILEDKFGFTESDLPANPGKGALLVYACIAKNIAFARPFKGNLAIDFPGPAGPVTVSAFGYEGDDDYDFYGHVSDQVKIDYYDPDTRDCVIRLRGSDNNDEIVLALVSPGRTLLETIDRVKGRLTEGQGERLHVYDYLMVPKIVFRIKHEYSELCGKPILNLKHGNDYYYFKSAVQFTDFRLDERGAELKVRVMYGMEATGKKDLPDLRVMIFNRPFLVMLKPKSSALPYFAAWIANPELLFPDKPELFAPKEVTRSE